MKVIKVLLTIVLSVIMFVLVGTLGVITAGRILLSGNNIGNIAEKIVKESGDININEVLDSSGDIDVKELTDVIEKIDEYADMDEVYKEFGNFTSQILKYSLGTIDDIETKELKKVIKKAVKKYEAKTGESIDLDALDDSIDEEVKNLKKELKEERKSSMNSSDESERIAFKILRTALDDKLFYGLIIGIVVIAAIIFLINMSVVPLCVSTIIISALGIIANAGLFIITKVVEKEDLMMRVVMNNMSHIFLGIAIAFVILIILSIIGIVVGVSISNKKKKVITT